MVKKSKKEQNTKKPNDDQFVEIPEDRIEQIEGGEPQAKPEKKRRGKGTALGSVEQAQAQKDALPVVTERSKSPREDLLADVRQSLLDEAEVVAPKGLFERIKDKLKKPSKSKAREVETQTQFEVETEMQEGLQELVFEPKQRKRRTSSSKEEEKAIQEFFSDLEAFADVALDESAPSVPVSQEIPTEVAKLDTREKIFKLPSKSTIEDEVDFDAVREMALQEYDETKIEPEERKPPIQEEVRRTLRELKPVERNLLIIAGVLAVGVMLFSGIYLIVDSISIPTPAPTAEVDLMDIVHPTRLSLPGGWEFNLGQGKVSDGKWAPQGAEWLVGTEISRWVALPWSLQLEAVLRTLKSGDQIELMMSNFDVLVFKVYSIQQMTMAELLASDMKTPGLLIVLYSDEEGDGTFWVVSALP